MNVRYKTVVALSAIRIAEKQLFLTNSQAVIIEVGNRIGVTVESKKAYAVTTKICL